MNTTLGRSKPQVVSAFCKACGRCIEACVKDCIHPGTAIDPATGLMPVVVDLGHCSSCGLCFSACPEPYGLAPAVGNGDGAVHPSEVLGPRTTTAPVPYDIPDTRLRLPETEPLVIKGTYASAIGAILAGCRHFFGYPITPSTEGAELMASLLPKLDGVFLQAVSEVATVNLMYGCGGAGLPSMTFTSSPGFSLMLEGISYMIGAEVPGVFVNVMRGGPGLGNIGPEQADIKLACHGLGHGNTRAIVLAPATPQEMLDFTMRAFELSFLYRNPVIVLCDGYLGQMTGRVTLPDVLVKPGIPRWAVYGDRMHRGNLISSIQLLESDLEAHNRHLNEKYRLISETESRAQLSQCEDADLVIVACNTPARMAKGAVQALRHEGIRAGLFRPQTLWPFPTTALVPLLERARGVLVVEASDGQLEDEMRLGLSHAGVQALPPIASVRRMGGVLPQQGEIVAAARLLAGRRGVAA